MIRRHVSHCCKLVMLCLPITVIGLLGCSGGESGGGGEASTGEAEAVQSMDDLKSMLNFVIESGEAGSALGGMQSQIESISDASKRDALMAEYKKLEAASTPAARQAAAKAMLSKL